MERQQTEDFGLGNDLWLLSAVIIVRVGNSDLLLGTESLSTIGR